MSVQKSSYLLLTRLKAFYELERDKEGLNMRIRKEYAEKIRRINLLLEKYNFKKTDHEAFFSPHAMTRSIGCGCAYCTSLHKYAYSKLHLHYLKKSFETDFTQDILNAKGKSLFSIEDNFYALYSEHCVNTSKEGTLSQVDFFNLIYNQRKAEIKKYREAYRTIKKEIDAILSS